MKDENYREAKEHFTRELVADPSNCFARHQLALICGFEGDLNGSLLDLEALSNQYPSNLDLRYDFAMTQMLLGHFEDACSNLKAILAVDPHHTKALQQVTYC